MSIFMSPIHSREIAELAAKNGVNCTPIERQIIRRLGKRRMAMVHEVYDSLGTECRRFEVCLKDGFDSDGESTWWALHHYEDEGALTSEVVKGMIDDLIVWFGQVRRSAQVA